MTAVHFLILVVGPSFAVHTKPDSTDSVRILSRGDQLMITNEVKIANTGSDGRCRLLELLDDPDRQVREQGSEMIRRGPWPGGSRLIPGSLAWQESREAARQAAHRLDDEQEKLQALQQVELDYGPRPTSRTTATYRP